MPSLGGEPLVRWVDGELSIPATCSGEQGTLKTNRLDLFQTATLMPCNFSRAISPVVLKLRKDCVKAFNQRSLIFNQFVSSLLAWLEAKKPPTDESRGLKVGGGGGNRTRVRKSSA